ncbi:MAG: hypothetical protein DWQ07_15455 [Chloroflexi bacterium]|nr:MAG: hypothetical protein DWQ07_15455 [Chloroflexota bacterium]
MYKFVLVCSLLEHGEVEQLMKQIQKNRSTVFHYKAAGLLIRELFDELREHPEGGLPSENFTTMFEVFKRLGIESMRIIWGKYTRYGKKQGRYGRAERAKARTITRTELLRQVCWFADSDMSWTRIRAYYDAEYGEAKGKKVVGGRSLQGDIPSDIAGAMAVALIHFTEACEDNFSINGIKRAYQKAQLALRSYREAIVEQNKEVEGGPQV